MIIGANGSGKTRLGVWLEAKSVDLFYRVGAHRALVFPDRVQPTDLVEAELRLHTGHIDSSNKAHYRQHTRWENKPAISLLNDYEPLLTYMVSESFTISDEYRVSQKGAQSHTEPPETRLDKVKVIWESVLPARELVITGSRIETRNRASSDTYHAREMSDGERGVFYLIGEALSVPSGGVFIVDEPELHLHRAIQARLWDAIEAARPDCTYIYITHDLNFAASRKDATKVWLRDYANDKWDWEVVPATDELPETLLLEVMGSRQPVLFVEGDKGSLDTFIYSRLFPGHCIIPCGSCDDVIYSTTSFTARKAIHHHDCQGIVDSDGRSAADIDYLKGKGIRTTPVSEVENLFLTETVLRLACLKLDHDPEVVIPKVKTRVLEAVSRNRIQVISNLVRQEIESTVTRLGGGKDGVDELDATYGAALASVKPREIYDRWNAEIERVLTAGDYEAALRYYKNKGLASEAGNVLAVRYADQVQRWLKGEASEAFVKALQAAIPWSAEFIVPSESKPSDC